MFQPTDKEAADLMISGAESVLLYTFKVFLCSSRKKKMW